MRGPLSSSKETTTTISDWLLHQYLWGSVLSVLFVGISTLSTLCSWKYKDTFGKQNWSHIKLDLWRFENLRMYCKKILWKNWGVDKYNKTYINILPSGQSEINKIIMTIWHMGRTQSFHLSLLASSWYCRYCSNRAIHGRYLWQVQE